MSELSIRLFGKLSVSYNSEIVRGLESCKVREMFCYLLLYRSSPHPRESLAGLLWGESSSAQSKKYLRQTLWEIQRALQQVLPARDGGIFLSDAEWLYLNPSIQLWLDVAHFERASTLVQGVDGADMDETQTEALRGAIQLYQGDLLEGSYQDWCLYERERLQSDYLTMLDKLMRWCEAHRDYEAGLAYGHRVLRYERARECTHRCLMRLYYLAGDRTAALRQYRRCVAALAEELEVKPAKHTIELYDQIRADDLETLAGPSRLPASMTGRDARSHPELIQQLGRLRERLNEIQRQVQQDIRALDAILTRE